MVGPTLYRYLSSFEIPIELYAPRDTPESEMSTAFLGADISAVMAGGDGLPAPKVLPAEVALVEIIARLTRERFRPAIGRTIVQKVAYFATVAGIPTGLTFEKGSYGPFSAGLKPLVARLSNNGLLAEERQGQMFAVTPGLTYADGVSIYRESLAEWEVTIERVVDLFLRVTTSDAEVAATVLFAARQVASQPGLRPTEVQVFEFVKEWKLRRKPPLDDHSVAEAIRYLNILGWIDAIVSPELPLPDSELLAV